MKKVKIEVTEFSDDSTAKGVVGVATFDPNDLPNDLKLPSRLWLAKRWRKWKAYERVWDDVCKAHDADDRDSVQVSLKALIDPVDFIEFLLEFYSEPRNTSKAGGDTRSAMIEPLRKRARRLFEEKKKDILSKGKDYSQRQFAEFHRNELETHYSARLETIREVQIAIDRINAEIKLGDLSAPQLRLKREQKRNLEEDIRIKPFLPSVRVIEGWLAGL